MFQHNYINNHATTKTFFIKQHFFNVRAYKYSLV